MTGNPTPDPGRFVTPRSTLIVDRVMTWVIKAGGIGIIIAVSGIFVFILAQILPLFRSARIAEASHCALPVSGERILALGLDEWGEAPVVVDRDGTVSALQGDGTWKNLGLDCGGHRIASGALRGGRLTLGCQDGTLVLATIAWTVTTQDGVRRVAGSATRDASIALSDQPGSLVDVAYAEDGPVRTVAAISDGADGRHVRVVDLEESGGLIGARTLKPATVCDLGPRIPGRAERVLVDHRGNVVVVTTDSGELMHFARTDQGFILQQPPFRPFADDRIASIDWLLGDVSLVVTDVRGHNRLLSLFIATGNDHRQFGTTKDFPDLPATVAAFATSPRNKCFLLASGRHLSLRHGTSASVRAALDLPWSARQLAIAGKYHRIAACGDDGQMHLLSLDDAHPETGLASLFGRVWYEGNDGPSWQWQSSGASDDIEPKLSMVPLIWGTLKATFFAMLFAVPIALLGAIYTAEFMHPRFKQVIKPTVETMASLPSVVLGFIGALWLAQILETRLPSFLLIVLLVPTAAMVMGWWWSGLSMRWRSRIRPGYEWVATVPLLLLVGVAAWMMGPSFENWCFVPAHPVMDPVSGAPLGNFRQWWREATGLTFDQRNALVVGLMMGFAVIPIIFTIAEDALANVPSTLRSGSLALGASRWQTALRVVVPTASPGIFSAIMIGLGRAIGETMIVVMATGNTAIMSGNIFDGMRTLSANIAVELPEAPYGGTLFRTLYLGAFLLFVMTFAINTAAELTRQHLREKYKTV